MKNEAGDMGARLRALIADLPRPIQFEALGAFLEGARARDLIWLEANRWIYRDSYTLSTSWWMALAPERVGALPLAGKKLASFHPNGHVREAAVISLASAIDDGALAFLLFRANDWVLPVAMRAHSMLVNALQPKHAAAWIAALPFEKHVRELRRRDLNPIVDDARRLVLQPTNRAAFSRALREAPVDVRRACAALIGQLPIEDRQTLLATALNDRDQIVALRAARSLFEAREGLSSDALIDLSRHRQSDIRARALSALWERSDPAAHARTLELVFDPIRSVREVARFELDRHEKVDALDLYLRDITTAHAKPVEITIAGIAETGRAEHSTFIAPYLRSPTGHVRLAAVAALTKLAGDDYVSDFLLMVSDRKQSVVRAVRRALSKRGQLVGRDRIDKMLASGGSAARLALELLPQLDHWDALLASLRAVADPGLRDKANAVIDRLRGRQAYSTPKDAAALRVAFIDARPFLVHAHYVQIYLAGFGAVERP